MHFWIFCLYRWNGKFEHFCILQPTVKQEAMNGGLDLNNSVETSCPLGHTYDADIHDAIAHLRILDGSLPAHPTHGRSVNFFAEVGRPKYWIEASSPVFAFFLYYTLDKAVCPFLATIFGMPIWHPTNEAEVDTLLEAQVKVYVSQLCLSCSSLAVAAPWHSRLHCFADAWILMAKPSSLFICSMRIWWMTFFGSWASEAQSMLKRCWDNVLIIVIVLILIVLGPHG